MLGSQSDRPSREQSSAITSTSSSYHSKPSHPFSEMSPPQQSVKSGPGDYTYKPRSQTPDRMGISNLIGSRPYRSGSGSIMQASRPFEDPARVSSRAAFPRFRDGIQQAPGQEQNKHTEDRTNHVRRTSIPGILQRPSSQPQPQVHGPHLGPRLQPVNHPQPNRSSWPEHSNGSVSTSFNTSSPPSVGVNRGGDFAKMPQNEDAPRLQRQPGSTILGLLHWDYPSSQNRSIHNPLHLRWNILPYLRVRPTQGLKSATTNLSEVCSMDRRLLRILNRRMANVRPQCQ